MTAATKLITKQKNHEERKNTREKIPSSNKFFRFEEAFQMTHLPKTRNNKNE